MPFYYDGDDADVTWGVTVSLRNISVPAGHDVTIHCSSEHDTYWNFVGTNATKNSTGPRLICYRGLSIPVNRQKYRCPKTSAGQWPVVIRNFGQSDVGQYTCWDTRNPHDRDTALLSLACKYARN